MTLTLEKQLHPPTLAPDALQEYLSHAANQISKIKDAAQRRAYTLIFAAGVITLFTSACQPDNAAALANEAFIPNESEIDPETLNRLSSLIDQLEETGAQGYEFAYEKPRDFNEIDTDPETTNVFISKETLQVLTNNEKLIESPPLDIYVNQLLHSNQTPTPTTLHTIKSNARLHNTINIHVTKGDPSFRNRKTFIEVFDPMKEKPNRVEVKSN